LVKKEDEIISSLRMAKSEALAAFGDETVYVEKYISSPHHIEFQVLADKFGHTIHLFERECSVQRRHQKVIEETPSPLMTEELRNEMGEKAIAAAKSVDYEGAGTIEFLVDDKLNYYFLEMNTRLQVEHPITERVTGVDLVKWQIKIAQGDHLEIKQEELIQFGHAIECRIYAEDPDNNFMPSPGVIQHISEPMGTGIRTDGYVYEGYEIPLFYDPMISKLIIWGRNRSDAIERMKRALYEYKIAGVKTSIKFLERVMNSKQFIEGKYDTNFIADNEKFLMKETKCNTRCEDVAIMAAFIDYNDKLIKAHNGHYISNSENWKAFGRKKSVTRL
jgi:acetyl-CoA carboxylase, biotin carboxylase subunit